MGTERATPWQWSDIFSDGEAEPAEAARPVRSAVAMELEFRRFHALFHANKNQIN